VTLNNSLGQRADLGYGLYALTYPNAAPQFISTPLAAATAGQAYSYTAQAQDPDGVLLSYVLIEAPAGMTVDSQTGVVDWAPTAQTPAEDKVVLRAYDTRGGFATQIFTIDVAGGNVAPVLGGIGEVVELQEGEAFSLPVSAGDPEGVALSCFVENLPPGATFDAERATFNWTPGYDQAGEYRDVRFYVTDGINTVSQVVSFTVYPANAKPVILGVPERTVRQGDPLRIRLSASDFDNDKLSFGSYFLPGGAWLDPNTGVFEWTPGFDQVGDYTFDLFVSDGRNVTATATTIHILNVNATPVFDQLDGWNTLEGEAISFRAFAFDPDNPGFIPQDRLSEGQLTELEGTNPSVTLAVESLPPGATFDAATGIFNWVPDYEQAGQYSVRFIATDDGNGTGVPLSGAITMSLQVRNANRAPVVPELGTQTVQKGQILEVPINVTDPDGNPLNLRFDGLPRFASFIPGGNGSGILRLAPGDRDRGDYVVTLVAADNGDAGKRCSPPRAPS
jgi:hypothetical protein